MKLQIVSEDGRIAGVDQDTVPELVAAFQAWQGAPRSSQAEPHQWLRVLELASAWLAHEGTDVPADDVLVTA